MPFGSIMGEKEALETVAGCKSLVTVGDVVSMTMLQNGLRPKLMIYDFQTERRKMDRLRSLLSGVPGEPVRIKNPPGFITPSLVRGIESALSGEGSTKIQVEGEEDLAAPVCAALAPEGTCLVYGMPGKGMVVVEVDAEVRRKARTLIESMEEWE